MACILIPRREVLLACDLRQQGLEERPARKLLLFSGPVIRLDKSKWRGEESSWQNLKYEGLASEPEPDGSVTIRNTPYKGVSFRCPEELTYRLEKWCYILHTPKQRFVMQALETYIGILEDTYVPPKRIHFRKFQKPPVWEPEEEADAEEWGGEEEEE